MQELRALPANSSRMKPLSAFWSLSGVLVTSVCLPLPGTDGKVAHLPALCPFYLLTGLPCPGCGLTRSFICLGHGRLAESLHWNPLGWLLFGLCVLLWLRVALFLTRGITLWTFPARTQSHLSFGLFVLLFIVGAVRVGWLTAYHLRF